MVSKQTPNREFFTLTPKQVHDLRHCWWYMNVAQLRGRELAAKWTPGMGFSYVIKSLGRVGAIVGGKAFNACVVAPGLTSVILCSDGSAEAYFENGTLQISEAWSLDE